MLPSHIENAQLMHYVNMHIHDPPRTYTEKTLEAFIEHALCVLSALRSHRVFNYSRHLYCFIAVRKHVEEPVSVTLNP